MCLLSWIELLMALELRPEEERRWGGGGGGGRSWCWCWEGSGGTGGCRAEAVAVAGEASVAGVEASRRGAEAAVVTC